MERDPYQHPHPENVLRIDAPPRNWRPILWCFGFAVLFAVMFVGTVQKFDGTLGNLVFMGWSFCTSLGCCGMSWGLFSSRRWPAVGGACLVLLALAAMFTVVIRFSDRLRQAIGG